MKVIHLTTWKEVCGIADYTSNLIQSFEKQDIYNEVYPINRSSLQYLSLDEIRKHFADFANVANDFDIVHIQHEHGFFHGSYFSDKSIDIFAEILVNLRKKDKKVVVTFHTEPVFVQPIYKVLSNTRRNFESNFYELIQNFKWKTKIVPIFNNSKNAFTSVVHTKKSRLSFINSGFNPKSVRIIKHGVVTHDTNYLRLSKSDCKAKLNLNKNTKLLSIFGFVSKYKGYEIAINALKYLPSQYNLAIIGGTHPNDKEGKTMDEIIKLIIDLDVRDRVLITGFVEFEVLDLFHGATDICLAPYLPSTLSASGALTWAFKSGKPIIASKIPAFDEINQEYNCMFMIAPECCLELALGILNLDKNQKLQEQLVNNALKYTEKNSWDNIGKIYLQLYKELINHHVIK
jgi:glycosyltransferase involved in cell wall biosynthesis